MSLLLLFKDYHVNPRHANLRRGSYGELTPGQIKKIRQLLGLDKEQKEEPPVEPVKELDSEPVEPTVERAAKQIIKKARVSPTYENSRRESLATGIKLDSFLSQLENLKREIELREQIKFLLEQKRLEELQQAILEQLRLESEAEDEFLLLVHLHN